METGIPTKCEAPTRRRSTFNELRHWYGQWVRLREARYRYLEAILNGEPGPDAPAPSRAEPSRADNRTEKKCIQPGDQA
jgi:hypothetical protein